MGSFSPSSRIYLRSVGRTVSRGDVYTLTLSTNDIQHENKRFFHNTGWSICVEFFQGKNRPKRRCSQKGRYRNLRLAGLRKPNLPYLWQVSPYSLRSIHLLITSPHHLYNEMKEQSVIFIRLTPSDKKKVKTACVKRNKTYSQAILEWATK